MARMRTLKPEYWTDPVIVTLTPWARLLYIGMWGLADEWGVLRDEPMRLKLQVLPADDVDIAALVNELATAGRVARMTTPDGVSVLVIPRFRDHQKTDPRLTPKYGDPQTFTPTNTDPHPRTPTNTNTSAGVRGQGSGMGSGVRGQGSGEPRASRKRPALLPDDWQPTDTHRTRAAELHVDCDVEAERMRNWALGKGETRADWDRVFANWLLKASENRRPANGTSPARTRAAELGAFYAEQARIAEAEGR